jgi:hypothetical protein
MFDFVDVDKEREKGLEEDDIELEHLDVTDWLKNERLSCPRPLESAYALRDENGEIVGESLPFTNVTFDFVGALDYVLFDTSHFRPTERLYVPTSFKELNGRDLPNGHLLPSIDWPSDHLAVGVQLELVSGDAKKDTRDIAVKENGSDVAQELPLESNGTNETLYCGDINGDSSNVAVPAPAPNAHPPRCACGCVPNILSMFEMAELRKQAKLKAAAKDNGS